MLPAKAAVAGFACRKGVFKAGAGFYGSVQTLMAFADAPNMAAF
jgi:hypothetical protein